MGWIMKINDKIEREITLLEKERVKYLPADSWDYKYRYYTFTGKIDILMDLLRLRKIRLKEVETLKFEIQKNYKKIRMIPKHKRNELNFFTSVDPCVPNANNVFLQVLDFNSIMDNLVLSNENAILGSQTPNTRLITCKHQTPDENAILFGALRIVEQDLGFYTKHQINHIL